MLRLPPVLHKALRFISHPSTLTGFAVVCFVYFLLWLLLTVIPVAIVEAKYQTRRFVTEVLQVNSLQQLIFPNFSALNFRDSTSYPDYGIVIPKLYLDEPVVFNVDPNDKRAYTAALKQGIAHASGTAFPDDAGVGYYFAHSSSPEFRSQYNAVFYLLGKLKPGDDIYIWHENQSFKYVVSQTKVTSPDDLSFLSTESSQETIVLQTCWPPGTTQKRLLVFAERVSD